ncbi:hypothetical protein FQN53_006472 [Emmonsiellopsis sp. PD_33]|nr:hypothetical protein FQN53_006472 [Emmonsiellopsis sp. PD_33]
MMPYILVTICCAFAALGSFLFGYDSGIIASSIAQDDFVGRFGGQLDDATTGGIVSSFTGGAIVGSIGVSYLSDAYGRRVTIFVGGVLAAFGGALQGGAVTIAMLVAGRFIAGLAIGLMSATVPAFPAIFLAFGALFLPETPRWLIGHGKPEAGLKVLIRLHSNHKHTNNELVHHEYEQIRDTIAREQQETTKSWREILITRPSWRRRILLASGIQAFTQCSGVNVINYYGPRIYATLGFSTSNALMIIGISGALSQTWNTVCLGLLDNVGRRKLLIPSLLGMGATLCVEATLSRYFDPDTSTNTHALRAAVAMYFVFSFFFTPLGVISWIYPSEIFPTAIRARGTSVSTFVNWGLNLVFAQCAPIGLSRLGYRFFYCFMAFNWVGAGLVWLAYPETVGRSLEEVQEVFLDGGTLPGVGNSNGGESGLAHRGELSEADKRTA